MSNLLTIDGQPISVSVVGPTQQALDGGESQLVPCGPDAKGITLRAGPHVVQSVAGHNPPCANTPTTCTGWNIDQLALDSAPGGGAGSVAFPTAAGTPQLPATQPGAAAAATSTAVHLVKHGAKVTGASEPFELVLGQSVNKGWKAVASPGPGAAPGSHAVDLGQSHLVDGFANGWQVTAADLQALGGSTFTVQITWAPQNVIWAALAVSGATLLLCLVLGFLPRGRGDGCGRTSHGASGAPRGLSRPSGRPCPSTRPSSPCPAHPPRRRSARRAGCAFPGHSSSVPSAARPPCSSPRHWRGSSSRRRSSSACSCPGPVSWPAWPALRASWPAPSTWCRDRTCTTSSPVRTGTLSFINAGNLIWLGAVLLLADGVISAFGLRVAKPVRRGKLRARATSDVLPPEKPPVIIGIDG